MGATISCNWGGLFTGCCTRERPSEGEPQEIDLRRRRRGRRYDSSKEERITVLAGLRPFSLIQDGSFAETGLWVFSTRRICIAAHRPRIGCFLSAHGDIVGRRISSLPGDLRIVFAALFTAAQSRSAEAELQTICGMESFLLSAHRVEDDDGRLLSVVIASRPQPDIDFSRFLLPKNFELRERAESAPEAVQAPEGEADEQ